ncbi:hypothetical protein ACE1SV_10980 [Streptomyces sp. E-15]
MRMLIPHRNGGFGGPGRRYGRRARPDKQEPLRAGARFVAWTGGRAAIRCASGPPAVPDAVLAGRNAWRDA